MYNKVIVIGMDNTGKTTLVDQLSDLLGYKVYRPLGPGKSKNEMLSYVTDNLKSDEAGIFERFSIFEELIYGNILRGESKFTYDDIKILREFNPLVIYCRPSDGTILDFGDREQMEGVISQGKILIKEWDKLVNDLYSELGFKVKVYNYKVNSLKSVSDAVREV